jgi:hypothetical protein
MLGYFVLGFVIGWAIGTYVMLVIVRNRKMRLARAQMAMMDFLHRKMG